MTPPTVIGQEIQLALQASPGDWQGSFDQMEVWKSTCGPDGPYMEMTASTWQPPTFPADLYGVVAPGSPITGQLTPITGLVLSLLLDEETEIDVTFVGSNITFGSAATQIQSQSNQSLVSFVWTDGRLVVMGKEPGNKAILRVLGGDAAPLLGLPTTSPGNVAYGKDSRIDLISSQSSYQFTDFHGDPSYYYKTRYRQSTTNTVSNFSLPFAAFRLPQVDPTILILGTIDLVDAQGRPVHNREIVITTKFGGVVVGASGVIPRDITQLTDINGHAQFMLLRGLQITVSVAGTQLVRDVTVPTDQTLSSFGLLDSTVGSNDVFVVQVPDVDFVVRRSL